MENFSIVKRGYNPQEVDEYIATLEQVIKSYKDKDNAIKNAIISAQVAADNILKNAHLEIAENKDRTLVMLRRIYDSIEAQRSRIQQFQDEYNDMLRRYMRAFDESDVAAIYARIDDMEQFLRELSTGLETMDDEIDEE